MFCLFNLATTMHPILCSRFGAVRSATFHYIVKAHNNLTTNKINTEQNLFPYKTTEIVIMGNCLNRQMLLGDIYCKQRSRCSQVDCRPTHRAIKLASSSASFCWMLNNVILHTQNCDASEQPSISWGGTLVICAEMQSCAHRAMTLVNSITPGGHPLKEMLPS